MDRKASVVWKGSIKNGQGHINTESQALQYLAYSFDTRFGEHKGTNPEELIAAAHAACFAMATSGALTKAGFEPQNLDVNATVTIQKDKDSWTVGSSKLQLKAQIANISEDQFQKIAQEAKANCPVSRLLKAKITLEAKLENSSNVGASKSSQSSHASEAASSDSTNSPSAEAATPTNAARPWAPPPAK